MFRQVLILVLLFLTLVSAGAIAQSVKQRTHNAAAGSPGKLRTLSPEERGSLLTARESAWRAFFTGDVATLKNLLPKEFIGLNESGGEWRNRATVLENSKSFAASGGKLIRLEFPKTEIQAYGATAIIYTTFLYEIEAREQRHVSQGRATEMFVLQNGAWIHNGWHLDAVR